MALCICIREYGKWIEKAIMLDNKNIVCYNMIT